MNIRNSRFAQHIRLSVTVAAFVLCFLLGFALEVFGEDIPDAPVPISVTHSVRPTLSAHDGFWAHPANRYMAAGEFTTRLLDAISTEQFMHDPCKCITEKGTFYGLFSLKPVAAHPALQYTYSLGMAAGYVEVSRLLWNHAEHSRHSRLYRFASRGLLAYDTWNTLAYGPINNWRLIATNGKRGFSF